MRFTHECGTRLVALWDFCGALGEMRGFFAALRMTTKTDNYKATADPLRG